MKKISRRTALEAKALVYLAFRLGPIEYIHAGRKKCPTCRGNPDYNRISGTEMKQIMKAPVDRVATLLMLREDDPEQYEQQVVFALGYLDR